MPERNYAVDFFMEATEREQDRDETKDTYYDVRVIHFNGLSASLLRIR